MLRLLLNILLLVGLSSIIFSMATKAEEIHFYNDIFQLKYSALSPDNNGYENEYFPAKENRENWSKMVGIYYYPDQNNPIKFAAEKTKNIESNERDVLLKFIENKKADKAALSYLENGTLKGKNFFEYNILKYEKHPTKGMMALRYAIRYFFNTNNEITSIGTKVKSKNDDYLTKIIESPIPPIIEKEINNS